MRTITMLVFTLKYENENEAVYEYLVEGRKEDCGVVAISKKSGECKVIELPHRDRFKIYAYHMFAELREFLKQGIFKKSGTVMWY